MGHWAKVNEKNIVTEVIVAEDTAYEWLTENLGGRWIQTSYNTRGNVHYDVETGEPSEDQSKALRKNYANMGYYYDEELDAFIPPKPDYDATLNEETGLWDPVESDV